MLIALLRVVRVVVMIDLCLYVHDTPIGQRTFDMCVMEKKDEETAVLRLRRTDMWLSVGTCSARAYW